MTMVATCRNFELARDELVVQLSVEKKKYREKGILINKKKVGRKEDNDEEKWF